MVASSCVTWVWEAETGTSATNFESVATVLTDWKPVNLQILNLRVFSLILCLNSNHLQLIFISGILII